MSGATGVHGGGRTGAGAGPGPHRPGGSSAAASEAALLLARARVLLAEAQAVLVPPPEGSGARAATGQAAPRARPRLVASAALVLAVCVGLGLSAAGAKGLIGAGGQVPAGILRGPPPAASPATVPPVTAPVTPTTDPVSQGVPRSLSIPRLGRSAPVLEAVGIIGSGPEQGLLSAPDNYHDLGWYRHGDSGILLIDGHVGYRQSPGPLTFIGQLAAGDTLVVTFAGGTQTYRVTQVASIVKGKLPPGYFSSAYDGWLMLITCDYNSPFHAGHFANNVYVVASPE